MLIETSLPLILLIPSGELRLKAGQFVDLPDEQAKRLIEKAAGKVRVVSLSKPVMIQSPLRQPRSVYWERADGSIAGPAEPEILECVEVGSQESFWVVVQYEGVPVWISSAVLRTDRGV
ncbi:protein of unknown function [Nitrospira japonica]|uniref:Uncharacterized protein n=1 Tax=Nitrospira japonica TaxID=1325564 RepID=A0A1W1I315_9BACT|nr:protein of unknown function [Nitrospira japonica]